MKIISYNVNGIRAAINKGFVEWLSNENPDVICIQEVKALENQIDTSVFTQLGYTIHWCAAQKKGYSGVAVFSKIKANASAIMGIDKYDSEGRLLRLSFDDFELVNTYMPSGTSGDLRQEFKYEWLNDFYTYTENLLKEGKKIVVCGDFNICHKEIDIHNPTRNKNTSGFLPEEREWVTKFLALGFTDCFRYFDATPHKYSWWSYRAAARQKNLGWRIDYFVSSSSLDNCLNDCKILSDVVHSDHCPVLLDIKCN